MCSHLHYQGRVEHTCREKQRAPRKEQRIGLSWNSCSQGLPYWWSLSTGSMNGSFPFAENSNLFKTSCFIDLQAITHTHTDTHIDTDKQHDLETRPGHRGKVFSRAARGQGLSYLKLKTFQTDRTLMTLMPHVFHLLFNI